MKEVPIGWTLGLIAVMCLAFAGLALLSGDHHVARRVIASYLLIGFVAALVWYFWDRWHTLE